jgi:predicted N-acetyltransferase YhbS
MTIEIETKSNKEISKFENVLMNRFKSKEYGREHKTKDFREDYPNSIFFFVKDKGKIVSFGAFRRLTLKYLGKNYNILGICNIFTIKRGKGYGKTLISAMINHLKKTGKTGLGTCAKNRTSFYKKAGLSVRKEFIRRVVYKNPKGKLEPETDADGVYYEGKDKLITRMLSGKSIAYTDLKDW